MPSRSATTMASWAPLGQAPIAGLGLRKVAVLGLDLAGVARFGLGEVVPGLLQRLPLGDVAADGQDGNLVFELDRRRADVDRDQLAGLGPMPPLEGDVPPFELDLEPIGEPGGEVGVVQVGRPEPKELRSAVPQASTGRRVGVEDPAFEVVNEDDVLDPLEERPSPPLRGHQRGLGLLPLGGVGHEREVAPDLPGFVPVDVDASLHRHKASVLAEVFLLVPDRPARRVQLFERLQARCLRRPFGVKQNT